MCRYSMAPYKAHYVCVGCRRAFKAADAGASGSVPCPECAQPAPRVGRDFSAPRRVDDRAWKALAQLVSAGVSFDSCGCDGPGKRPRSTSELTRARTQASRQRRGPSWMPQPPVTTREAVALYAAGRA